jgi:hypothetical protein
VEKRVWLRLPGRIVDKPIKVVSDAEAEECDFVVCMRDADQPVALFPDDVHGLCAVCLAPIHYRPHVPKAPPKICLQCAARKANEDSGGDSGTAT